MLCHILVIFQAALRNMRGHFLKKHPASPTSCSLRCHSAPLPHLPKDSVNSILQHHEPASRPFCSAHAGAWPRLSCRAAGVRVGRCRGGFARLLSEAALTGEEGLACRFSCLPPPSPLRWAMAEPRLRLPRLGGQPLLLPTCLFLLLPLLQGTEPGSGGGGAPYLGNGRAIACWHRSWHGCRPVGRGRKSLNNREAGSGLVRVHAEGPPLSLWNWIKQLLLLKRDPLSTEKVPCKKFLVPVHMRTQPG